MTLCKILEWFKKQDLQRKETNIKKKRYTLYSSK